MKRLWKKYLLYTLYIITGVGVLYVVLQFILAGYSYSWTGFGDYELPTGEIERGKTFWDWMDLLIIPLVLVLGAFFLNRSESAVERQLAEERRKDDRKLAEERRKEDRKLAEERAELEREIAKDLQQETALQAYLDRMSELLLEKKLGTTDVAEVRDVARTRTVSIVQVLNNKRIKLVIKFLREAKLIQGDDSILKHANMEAVDLSGVNLSDVNLQGANLKSADLRGVYLEGANIQNVMLDNVDMRGATLSKTNMQNSSLQEVKLLNAFILETSLQQTHMFGANLNGAILRDVNLKGAILHSSSFQGADMEGVNLEGAQLSSKGNGMSARFYDADLSGAKLKSVNLFGATVNFDMLKNTAFLKSVTMPDGTIHE